MISWILKHDVQDLDLCRFLNTAVFLSGGNEEAKRIVSHTVNPQIGTLKIPESELIGKVSLRWQF